MKPECECDLYIDIVYNYRMETEKYLWDNSKTLDDILKELGIKDRDMNYMYRFAIIIVGMVESGDSDSDSDSDSDY
jgi:hypothetical protein